MVPTYTAELMIETAKVKILQDESIQTDHVIEHRRPDIVAIEDNNYFGHPCSRAVDMAREHGPWTRVVCTELKYLGYES